MPREENLAIRVADLECLAGVVNCLVSAFPDELYQTPRSWAERAYPKLIHYNKLDKGGHFAAWEQPQLFSEEVRAGFRSLR
jgi:pimeloyl-ACP methyl ester carboxylesterase